MFLTSVMTGVYYPGRGFQPYGAHHGAHYGHQGHQGGQKWGLRSSRSSPQRSRSSPRRSRRSTPPSLAVAVQARPKVRSIGVQVELKKVVVWVIKFSDWFERYNERRFGKRHFTWTLRGPGRRRGGRRVQRAFAVLRAARAGWRAQWAAYGPDGVGSDSATEGPAWGGN